MSRGIRVTLVLTIVIIMGAVYFWGYHLPSQQVAVFSDGLSRESREIALSAESLVNDLSLPVFSDLTETPEVCHENLQKVSTHIDEYKQRISAYEKSLAFDQVTYIYGLTRSYAELSLQRDRAQVAVNQTRQVLERYELMTSFLADLTSIRAEQIAATSRLASTTDLNTYAGRTSELREDADKLQSLAERLMLVRASAEMLPIRDKISAYYLELSVGYRELAGAIDIAVDDTIYSIARRIEVATETYYRDIPSEFSQVMNSSATLKELGDLADKFVSS